MAQITRPLIGAILMGAGATRWETEQLCWHYIRTTRPKLTPDEFDKRVAEDPNFWDLALREIVDI